MQSLHYLYSMFWMELEIHQWLAEIVDLLPFIFTEHDCVYMYVVTLKKCKKLWAWS